ncbi:hypothetical protein EPNKCIFM_00154 [Klebsiella phage KP13-16]|nr:hypothetical protein vBKpMFBKp34_090 [Klebsiella phage vB_KpM_FBKp34]UYL04456.1 hypothetical protein EPNKCIFM_00154 [Klebsiella phage KP13-16]HBT0444759.1 hypothetical protein [Klebsiella pneumoniae]
MIKATKNISETVDGYGIIIAVHGDNEKWLASFEEDEDRNIRLDAPIKVLHQVGEQKTCLRSYKEYSVTNDLIKMLDFVIELFENAPKDIKRVLAF